MNKLDLQTGEEGEEAEKWTIFKQSLLQKHKSTFFEIF